MAVILIKLKNMFKQIDELQDHIDLVVYNPSARVPGFITEIDPVAAKGNRDNFFGISGRKASCKKNDPSR